MSSLIPRARLLPAALLVAVACATARPPAPEAAPAVVPPVVHAPPVPMAPTRALVSATPDTVGMSPRLGARLDSIVTAAIADSVAPGAALAVGRHGRLVVQRGHGLLDWDGPVAADSTTLYDVASLTKVVATTTAAMILEEEGRLVLDSAVRFYLPELDAPDKRAITVRMLLTHRGGLEAYAPLHRTVSGRRAYLWEINRRPLRGVPGAQTVYSDWDMVLLGLIIERITQTSLDVFVEQRVFGPLGMRDTRFMPDAERRARAAPTAVDGPRGGLLRGIVHDGNAWGIGGVSGHAGLFSTARDLAIFAQMLLDGGRYDTVRIVRASTVARWTSPQAVDASRALGWDTPAPRSSAGRHFSPRSFGHTGFTGTSLWIDPERGLFVVLLANRVHSRGASERHTTLRRNVADAVQSSILDAPLVDWESRP